MKGGRFGLALVAMGGLIAAVACVLADPPPLQVLPPPSRPLIISDLVTPRLDHKLRAPPAGVSQLDFDVAVRFDPPDLAHQIQWRVFADLDTATNPNPTIAHALLDDAGIQGRASTDSGEAIRHVGFSLSASSGIDFSTCHTFTFVVALTFNLSFAAEPDPPGGDRVTWFYEPVADCSFYDAAPPTDASADGADE